MRSGQQVGVGEVGWARFVGGGGEGVESKEGGVEPQSTHDGR